MGVGKHKGWKYLENLLEEMGLGGLPNDLVERKKMEKLLKTRYRGGNMQGLYMCVCKD